MELVKVENNQIIAPQEFIDKIVEFEKKALEIELQKQEFKESLLQAMEENGITNWKTPNGEIEVSYRKPSTRTTIDSTRLKKELPDIAEEYSKTSDVKSSITLKINA